MPWSLWCSSSSGYYGCIGGGSAETRGAVVDRGTRKIRKRAKSLGRKDTRERSPQPLLWHPKSQEKGRCTWTIKSNYLPRETATNFQSVRHRSLEYQSYRHSKLLSSFPLHPSSTRPLKSRQVRHSQYSSTTRGRPMRYQRRRRRVAYLTYLRLMMGRKTPETQRVYLQSLL